jgi:hypothetical protein
VGAYVVKELRYRGIGLAVIETVERQELESYELLRHHAEQ